MRPLAFAAKPYLADLGSRQRWLSKSEAKRLSKQGVPVYRCERLRNGRLDLVKFDGA